MVWLVVLDRVWDVLVVDFDAVDLLGIVVLEMLFLLDVVVVIIFVGDVVWGWGIVVGWWVVVGFVIVGIGFVVIWRCQCVVYNGVVDDFGCNFCCDVVLCMGWCFGKSQGGDGCDCYE